MQLYLSLEGNRKQHGEDEISGIWLAWIWGPIIDGILDARHKTAAIMTSFRESPVHCLLCTVSYPIAMRGVSSARDNIIYHITKADTGGHDTSEE